MVKITEDKIQEMIKLYNEGKTFSKISKMIGVSSDTVSKYLKLKGCAPINHGFLNRLNEEEKLEICDLYLDNKWDEIYKKYKFMTQNRVYQLASQMGVKKSTYFWTKEDEQLLVDNYGLPYNEIEKMMNGRHSAKAISTKAIKMGLTHSQEWTEQELHILKRYYSSIPKEVFLKCYLIEQKPLSFVKQCN